MYLMFIELGIQFLNQYLQGAKGGKLPVEILIAVQAAIDTLVAHKADIISKSNLDTQRG